MTIYSSQPFNIAKSKIGIKATLAIIPTIAYGFIFPTLPFHLIGLHKTQGLSEAVL